MKIPEISEPEISPIPRFGYGLPLFPHGLAWDEIEDMLTSAISLDGVQTVQIEAWDRKLLLRALDLHPRYRPSLNLCVGTQYSFAQSDVPIVATCVNGETQFRVEGYDPLTLTEDQWLYIPPNMAHEAQSESRSALVFVYFYRWNKSLIK
jgi:hypothetical protein